MRTLPSGTVTFLFTDVEGSTELVQRLGDRYVDVLEHHRRSVRQAVSENGGEIVDARGEEFFAAFAEATAAAAAAVGIQQVHGTGLLRVRIGLHTGEPTLSGDGYLGLDVHRAARICAAGHGGQILLSQTTRDLVPQLHARDLGGHRLHGIAQPERLFQLLAPTLPATFPPLRTVVARQSRVADVVGRLGRRRPRSLEDLGWQVRARMPATDEPTRVALAELGACLFAASRTSSDADRLLALVDRRLLHRRLREHQELGVLSQHARNRAEIIQQQIDEIDGVAQRRQQLADIAAGASDHLPLAAAVGLAERIRNADNALSAANDRARAALDEGAWRLRRTVHRGVYRAADQFAVPFVDEAGVERVAAFLTMPEARAYRRAQRLREKTFSTSHELDSYQRATRSQSEGRPSHVDTGAAGGAGTDLGGGF